jgi:hypothetical protein
MCSKSPGGIAPFFGSGWFAIAGNRAERAAMAGQAMFSAIDFRASLPK